MERGYTDERIPLSKARGGYDKLVTMYTAPGTLRKLLEAGGRDEFPSKELVLRGLDGLPILVPGNVDQVHVKAEKGYLTLGLRGKGKGSSMLFNDQLVDYTVESIP
jgi:hypothetical protein